MDKPVDVLKKLVKNMEAVIDATNRVQAKKVRKPKKTRNVKKVVDFSPTVVQSVDDYSDPMKRKVSDFDKLPIFEQLRRRRLNK